MSRAIWRALLLLAPLLFLLARGPATAIDGPTGARLAEILAKFDAYAEFSRQRWGAPGMAVAVIQGDRVAWSKAYGVPVAGEPAPVDTSTVFQIGSISKSFTATVMGTLVDEGKIAFDDRVNDRYPKFRCTIRGSRASS